MDRAAKGKKVREILCELLDMENRAEALRWDLRKFGSGGGIETGYTLGLSFGGWDT